MSKSKADFARAIKNEVDRENRIQASSTKCIRSIPTSITNTSKRTATHADKPETVDYVPRVRYNCYFNIVIYKYIIYKYIIYKYII